MNFGYLSHTHVRRCSSVLSSEMSDEKLGERLATLARSTWSQALNSFGRLTQKLDTNQIPTECCVSFAQSVLIGLFRTLSRGGKQ